MELMYEQYEQYRLISQLEKPWDVNCEVIVPDTQADVYRVLTAAAHCQVKQKTLRQESVLVEGQVEIEAICVEEQEDHLQIVRGAIPFAQEISLAGCTENSIVPLRLEVLRCDAQIRNPRKLQLQAQLSASVQMFQAEPLQITQNAMAADEEGLQLLTEQIELDIMRSVCEKKLIASDEVQIGQQGELAYYTITWRQEEQRVLADKVMLRGNALLQATFVQEGRVSVQEYAIPFSQVLECDGTQPGDQVVISYQTLHSQVTILEGDHPCLSCSLTGAAVACFVRKTKLQVLCDAYSTHYTTACKTQEIHCPKWKRMEQNLSVADSIHPQEEAVRVSDCCVRARGFLNEQGRAGAIYTFRFLYVCQEGHLHCVEHTVKALAEEPINMSHVTVRCGWRDLTTRVIDGEICVNFTAVLTSCGIEEQTCKQVAEIILNKSIPVSVPAAGTLLLRNVQPGETPWTIAKQYCSCAERIMEANHIDCKTVLEPGKLMIIPFAE